jgi:hypothetical protein
MSQSTKGKPGWRRWLYRGLGAAGAVLVLAFLAVSWRIGSDVWAMSRVAVEEYGGDPISALMTYVESSEHSLRDRNRAVWALGHLGDARALPVLEKHHTGEPCDHERRLCQRELWKAIQLCRGGLNLPALVWRHGSIAETGSS